MYIDIYFAGELPVDRDDVEDAFNEIDGFEVVGAGAGATGTHLDLEIEDAVPRNHAISTVTNVLQRFGAAQGARLRVSDPAEQINVIDVVQ